MSTEKDNTTVYADSASPTASRSGTGSLHDEKKDPVVDVTEELEPETGKKVLGLDYYENAQNITKEEIDGEIKGIRRKIDARILPLLCITYCLQFLNKLSLNYAMPYNFVEDLDLVGDRINWVAAIFNFGYLAGSLPANYLLQRVPVAKYTGVALFSWGVILVAHVGATNYGGMLALRFILGLLEACISPNCMNVCQLFYQKKDQPFRMMVFLSMNGISTMVGAILGFGLGQATKSSLAQWKLIFLLIGLLNTVWSGFFLWLCPDSPAQAKFLGEREKTVLIEVVSRNNQGLKAKKYNRHHVFEAFIDPSIWCLVIIGLACGVINGGVSNFSSAFIKGLGFDKLPGAEHGLVAALQMPTGAIEFVVVFGFGVFSLFYRNMCWFSFFWVCAIPLAGLIGIKVTPATPENRWALLGCTWLQFIVGGPVILTWVLLNANVAGTTKKTMANSLWFSFYAAGNIVGANIFFSYEAPKYDSAMTGLIVCYCGMIVLGFVYLAIMLRRNKKRTAEQGELTEEMQKETVLNGFKDFSDFENKGFRYAY